MTDILIIFIDSLPFALLPRMPFLGKQAQQWPINPGFGYSVNTHAELFAGLLPDDLGYFGEWMYNPAQSPGARLRPILPLLDAIFRPYVLNRGLQFLLTRRYRPGHPMPNIPLRHLDKFALEGEHIQSPEFPFPTLFTQFPHLHALQYRGIGRPKGERDAYIFEQGLAAIPDHSALYVPLPDLDGFGHLYGIDGEPYLRHLARLDEWVRELSQTFLEHYEDGHVFVISDHGMVNVEKGVYLDIEEKIGRASEQTYLYFSDANLLRIWVFDPDLHPQLRVFLEEFGHGQLLDSAQRQEYGLTSPRFGDYIYVLDEGLAFQPSTFARHIPKGMHGYHPSRPGQQAALVHIGATSLPGVVPRRMADVYRVFKHFLGGGT